MTFDTGRLFPETYDVWTRTEDHYGKRVAALFPEREHVEALVARQGVNGFRASVKARQACCGVRKFELLERTLTTRRLELPAYERISRRNARRLSLPCMTIITGC